MKIIEQGKQRGEMWPYNLTFKCNHCGCKFKIDTTDHYEMDNSDPREPEAAKIPCPNCTRMVYANR